MAQGEQHVRVMRALPVVQPTPDSEQRQEDHDGITRAPPQQERSANLEHVGFSREQSTRLFSIKERYQQGAYHESTAEYKRLKFVRWLYQHGRLQS